ncbi:MAG: hypothetical protein M3Z05_02475 [Gemmatimonadota bacterium]|nr:hypothetical protein [Gemmatimonadota bacterium]
MRNALFVSFLVATSVSPAHAQDATREYRPELIVTGPRFHGIAVQGLVEQHLQMRDLAPNERVIGLGLNTSTFLHIRAGLEARQILTPGALEHRYIPTLYSTTPLGAFFESRNRTRVELRDVAGTWSQRWQHRSAIGRDVAIAGLAVSPYGQVDLSYDSRVRTLNRTATTFGVRVPITPSSSIDTFFTHQDDTRRAPRTILIGGAIMRVTL